MTRSIGLSACGVATSFLAIVGLGLGCGRSSPSAPTPVTPIPVALSVTGVSPSSGSPSGWTQVSIGGAGFQSGATVTFDGTATTVTFFNSGYLSVIAPPKPAGPVDVVVTNPDGQTARLARAYTYAAVLPPSVAALSENVGSTSGGAQLKVTGTGFRSGMVVTFGGAPLRGFVEGDGTGIYVTLLAHAAGTVDVVVTNPDGQSSTLAGGYTYVSPESFDVNGQWNGGADSNYETPFRFVIQNNTLVSVSCGTSGPVTLSPPPSVRSGELSFAGSDGVTISGRIVSPKQAFGTIKIPGIQLCVAEPWYATKDI